MLYITYYTTADDVRISSPAANTKARCIAQALVKNREQVQMLSTCAVAKQGTQKRWIRGRRFTVDTGIGCKQFSFLRTAFGPLRRLQHYFFNLRIFLYLLLHAKKNEKVLFYHAIERSFPIRWAKAIKKFRLILEVEEIYANASVLPPSYQKAEQKCLRAADAYIFSNRLLPHLVNKQNKPCCVIYGTYHAEPVLETPSQDKIHAVYAGTLDPVKGGAQNAVNAALFLDERYHIHILGFGEQRAIEQLQAHIDSVRTQTRCGISYDGCLQGEAYLRFLQKCHIGLSTQDAGGAFNDTSFPSKILSYMANGLHVVTVRIPVLTHSDIDRYMHYYEPSDAEGVAAAIRSVDTESPCCNRQVLQQLFDSFVLQLSKMLQEI